MLLVHFTETWIHASNAKLVVGVAFIDFQNGIRHRFAKDPHSQLNATLESLEMCYAG